MYDKIFTPLNFGGLELKNRIVFAPTSFGLSKEKYLEKLCTIAAGGCSMIIVGDVPIGKHGPRSLHSKTGFGFYKRICDEIHKHDCKVCVQLNQSDSNIRAMIKYIPGVITKRISKEHLRNLSNEEVKPYISRLSSNRVRKITLLFGKAAAHAKEAGFDIIQIHGDRMCGSFSSSLLNVRTDSYGGSPERRYRTCLLTISLLFVKILHTTATQA